MILHYTPDFLLKGGGKIPSNDLNLIYSVLKNNEED